MNKLARTLVVALTTVAGVGIAAPPAPAATFDYLDAPGGRIAWNECESFDYAWAATDDSGLATRWEATATLTTPSGSFSDEDFSYGNGGVAEQADDFTVCWDEGGGRYDVEVEITFYDDFYDEVDMGGAATTMSVTRAPRPARKATRSSLRISDRTPHFNERVTFTLGSKIRRAGAWRRYAHAPALLAGRCVARGEDSGWVLLAEGELNRRGVGYVQLRYNIPRSWRCRFKSATYRTARSKSSVSRAVAVRTGRGPRARAAADLDSTATPRGRELAPRGSLGELLG